MANNPRKNKELKSIWFDKGEFKKLVHALELNDSEKVKDIMFAIFYRGDLE